MLWSLFFQCICCHTRLCKSTDSFSFPLCQICKTSLVDCPSLCKVCGSPLCQQNVDGNCLRPWRKFLYPCIDSFHSRYLLIGLGYKVLRKWKIHGGPAFNRQVLVPLPSLSRQLKELKVDGLVAIPQRFLRSWKLRGSRTESITSWLSGQLELPIFQFIKISSEFHSKKRQAELPLKERIQNQSNFSIQHSPLVRGKKILLVDDFMTTGNTFHQVASILKSAGAESIHAFSLGIRLSRLDLNAEHGTDLAKRRGGTIPITEKLNS